MKSLNIAFFLALISIGASGQVTLEVDAGKHYNKIDGFGVNINSAWWLDGEYRNSGVVKPAIDMLIDSLGATIFRVVIEEMDWEAVNDDKDPQHFNWSYYNKIFSGPRFRGVWNTLHYLNARGINDGLMLSFMGAPPAPVPLAGHDSEKSWVGGVDYSINPAMEDEFVESIAALLYYARETEKIDFCLVSPMNETDIISGTRSREHPDGIVEGPNIPDAVQYTRIVHKLAEKLDVIGLGNIRFVMPDAGGDKLFRACFEETLKDPYLLDKVSHWGVHQYGKDAANYSVLVKNKNNPVKTYWVTETAGIKNIMGQLDDNASAHIFWDGFDCVYQHGRRNGYGDVPPNDWVFWEGEKGKPLLEYNQQNQSWTPRKQFYEFAQLFRFVKPRAMRIDASANDSDLVAYAYQNPDNRIVIVGYNSSNAEKTLTGKLGNLRVKGGMKLYITNSMANLEEKNIILSGDVWRIGIPGETVFTLSGLTASSSLIERKPEPEGWYAGDMHVHRNCGDVTPLWSEDSLYQMMKVNDLSVISVLADIGNGEVKDSKADPGKVNGSDLPQSEPGRILHYDSEWHFDPAGVTFEHKALGGHVVILGLKKAYPMWKESPYEVLEWAKSQQAITGFCHMQYLNDSIQNQLTCCIPVDFPVEAALGTIDFLSEDVWLNDASINAYYKILNCGFRPGWCAGTDFPCNNAAPLGSLLTYVQVKGPLTYQSWIDGIRNGRTVVTTNGHREFLELKINGFATPGDEIKLASNGLISVRATWTSVEKQQGRIEIVCNGRVAASLDASAVPGMPVTLTADVPVSESSWICARRMNEKGHQSHTAPVYITAGNKPVRASSRDAEYYAAWIDNILNNIRDGGPWRGYFSDANIDQVRSRYMKAAAIYRNIANDAKKHNN